jgi:molecular chaperone DnaK (HSP70)
MSNNLVVNSRQIQPQKSDLSRSIDLINQKTFIGIDFGTSTTVVSLAYYDPHENNIKTQAIPLNQKMADGAIYQSEKIPSIIAWYNQKLLIGEGAKAVKLKRKKNRNVWHSFKMDLGNKNEFLYMNSELSNLHPKLLNGKDATVIFFKYLHQQIGEFIEKNNYPKNIEYSISIPASFEPNQRQDMINALASSQYKFNEKAFIDEPNAAFLNYISDPELQKNIHLSDEYTSNVLVFDYGAGTCDISILEVGLDGEKFTSSNIAISQFDCIGGKEIDMLISTDVLLPQLLEENNLENFHFTTRELNNFILPKLEIYAELLKIEVCQSLSLRKDKINKETHEEKYFITSPIIFKTKKGEYSIGHPNITFKQFNEIISIITSTSETGTYRINKNKIFHSIFKPVKNALRKAKLSNSDIDYILFIGGSSKNPLIRESVKEYFQDSEYLIPKDLQMHVSAGSAINSLLYNGFSENIISSITNEPIYLLINGEQEEELYLLLPAGSSIPSEKITVNNLTAIENSTTVELPICLSDKNNILYNLIIDISDQPDSSVSLSVYLDANKTIHCSAKIGGIHKEVKIENTLLRKSDTKEKIERAEYNYSQSIANQGGEETSEQLYNLYKTYKEEKEYFKAAEIAEELNRKHNKISLNNIGLLYRNAGDDEKAIHFYKKSAQKDRSANSFFNLAMMYEFTDKKAYSDNLKKAISIDPTNEHFEYELLNYEATFLDNKKSKEKIAKLYKKWKNEYENNCFPYHHSWLVSCANFEEDFEFARKVSGDNMRKRKITNSIYNKEHLATIKEDA